MPEKEIGKVTHWYDHISVAVLKLEGPLQVGDHIKVKKGDAEFDETISSLQIDHKDVPKAGPGDEVAIKLSQKTKPGAVLYLVKE